MRLAPERRSAQIIRPRQFRTPDAVLGHRANQITLGVDPGSTPAVAAAVTATGHLVELVEIAEFENWGPSRQLSGRQMLARLNPLPIVHPLPKPRSPLRARVRQIAARMARERGL